MKTQRDGAPRAGTGHDRSGGQFEVDANFTVRFVLCRRGGARQEENTYDIGAVATLLQKMSEERAARTERLRLTVREQLRTALREILPGIPVTVFGSLTQAGRFTDASDVDLALAAEPPGSSIYQLVAQLSERLGRRVDVILLSESRIREKILREGETWTP
jgi:predicted nucleotidyltransferase